MTITTKNYSKLDGPSHQCQYYSDERKCLKPNGDDVFCEFDPTRKTTGKTCKYLFEKTRMCTCQEAYVEK